MGLQQPLGKTERTKLALMLAAERLFGDLGIDAVGLRAVSEAAGQKNNNAVQYHFGDKMNLLTSIFEFREGLFQPLRQQMLEQAEAQGRLGDLRGLLRVCFEPNFRLYRDQQGISYLKLHVAYLATHRPRGVRHPVDYDSPNTVIFRRAIALLGQRLAFLGERRFWLRLESAGAMFLSALIQHSARTEERNLPADELFEDVIEMMAAALSAPPGHHSGTD
ncbi:hypothetical protein M622_17000 [Thauera terpenica 58Eu]|uniref:Uncharacterized protein n=2 Tax=Thauera terpenica TaxID=76113 RepID=S9ZNL6_9RHOO|nr:hypothetical protein M622_17000 [Thauera terpenica 58Eu]